ncbi:hypothetical protein Trydic_g18904 [Trypoxylus dichotomus]
MILEKELRWISTFTDREAAMKAAMAYTFKSIWYEFVAESIAIQRSSGYRFHSGRASTKVTYYLKWELCEVICFILVKYNKELASFSEMDLRLLVRIVTGHLAPKYHLYNFRKGDAK